MFYPFRFCNFNFGKLCARVMVLFVSPTETIRRFPSCQREASVGSGSVPSFDARVIARITKRFKVDIPIKTLFESPTVAKIAEILVINGAKAINDEDLPGILGEIESLSDEETQNHLRGKNN